MEGTPLNNWKVERKQASEILRCDAYNTATKKVSFIGRPWSDSHAISPPPWSTSHKPGWVYSMPSKPERHSKQRARCTRTGRFMSWRDADKCRTPILNTVVWVRPCWKNNRHIGGKYEVVMASSADGYTTWPRICVNTFDSLEEGAKAARRAVCSMAYSRGYSLSF